MWAKRSTLDTGGGGSSFVCPTLIPKGLWGLCWGLSCGASCCLVLPPRPNLCKGLLSWDKLVALQSKQNHCLPSQTTWVTVNLRPQPECTAAGQWSARIGAAGGQRSSGFYRGSYTPAWCRGRSWNCQAPRVGVGLAEHTRCAFGMRTREVQLSALTMGAMAAFSRNREQCSRPEGRSYTSQHRQRHPWPKLTRPTLMPPHQMSLPHTQAFWEQKN